MLAGYRRTLDRPWFGHGRRSQGEYARMANKKLDTSAVATPSAHRFFLGEMGRSGKGWSHRLRLWLASRLLDRQVSCSFSKKTISDRISSLALRILDVLSSTP